MSTETRICPFCRESFEGETRCPDHDLELVPAAELALEEATPELEPVRGKALVIAAAIAASVAFFFPFFEDAEGDLPSMSALGVALSGAESLWVSFLVPVVVFGTLFSTHDAPTLRRIRLALFLVTCIAVAAAALALHRGITLADAGGSTLTPGAGAYALISALVVMGIGTLRLGARAPLAKRGGTKY
jgi:peptidoglycan biosynthesis protein MviN/MurJ (putative lipid II flippase)